MEEGETENNKVSRYNSAQLLNIRLDSLWNDAKNHARTGQYDKWKADLDMIWTELAADTDESGNEEKRYLHYIKLLIGTGDLLTPEIKGFCTFPKERLLERQKQYAVLLNLQIFLKRLQNSQGKGTAYDMGEGDYLDG